MLPLALANDTILAASSGVSDSQRLIASGDRESTVSAAGDAFSSRKCLSASLRAGERASIDSATAKIVAATANDLMAARPVEIKFERVINAENNEFPPCGK